MLSGLAGIFFVGFKLRFAEDLVDGDAVPIFLYGEAECIRYRGGGVEGIDRQLKYLWDDAGSVSDPWDAVIFDNGADVIAVVPAVIGSDKEHGSFVFAVGFQGIDDLAEDGIAFAQDLHVFAGHPAVFMSAIVAACKVDEHELEVFFELRQHGALNGGFAVSDFKDVGGFGFCELTQLVFADDHDGLHASFVCESENVGSFGIAHVHKKFVVDHAVIFHADAGKHGGVAGRRGGIVDGARGQRGLRSAVAQCYQVGHGSQVNRIGSQAIVADDDDAFNIRFGGKRCRAGGEGRRRGEGGSASGSGC